MTTQNSSRLFAPYFLGAFLFLTGSPSQASCEAAYREGVARAERYRCVANAACLGSIGFSALLGDNNSVEAWVSRGMAYSTAAVGTMQVLRQLRYRQAESLLMGVRRVSKELETYFPGRLTYLSDQIRSFFEIQSVISVCPRNVQTTSARLLKKDSVRATLLTQGAELRQRLAGEELSEFPWDLYQAILIFSELDRERAFCSDGLDTLDQVFARFEAHVENQLTQIVIDEG